MKKKYTSFMLILLCFIMVFAAVLPIAAADPFQTYTYSSDGFALHSPAAYSPVAPVVDSAYIGLEVPFDDAKDLFVDPYNKVYLVDNANSRVIVMTDRYKLDFILETFVNEHGVHDSFKGPEGVFVNEEYIYVCDTENSRIVMFTREGEYVKIIEKPESALFGEDAIYQPVAMAVDQYGQIYVVSSSTYQGIIVMNDEGTFNGFIGAQAVDYNIFDIIWRRFQTEEQRKQSISYVPTSFNNIAIDEEGFIYVTNSSIEESNQLASITSKNSAYSPVKKLNSAGDEIMRRNGFFDPGGEVDIQMSSQAQYSGVSTIVDVGIGPEGTWSIVDSKRSKLFTYDSNGNLLFAFGDEGSQLGNLSSLGAVAYQGNYLLLLDADADCFTVYERTDYGDLLIDALRCENERLYDQAVESWVKVLQRNNNFDTAYIGIGKALYQEGNYEEAMEYLGSAYETTYYSRSYQEIRKEWIAQYFILIPIVVIAVCVGWVYLSRYAKRLNYAVAHSREKRTYWQEFMYSFHLVYHPFDGFWDLKHEKRGSMRAALTILGIVIVAFFYQAVGTGYLLNPSENYSTIFVQILAVGAPVLLWTISNWCLTTLFDGEGSLRDIMIACCYALAPLPILLIVSTLLSNVVTLNEAAIVSLLVTIGFIWAGFLLFFGMMVTHDYSLFKAIVTTLGTILAMAVIMFVAILFTSLLGKILGFITSIYTELSYRI